MFRVFNWLCVGQNERETNEKCLGLDARKEHLFDDAVALSQERRAQGHVRHEPLQLAHDRNPLVFPVAHSRVCSDASVRLSV